MSISTTTGVSNITAMGSNAVVQHEGKDEYSVAFAVAGIASGVIGVALAEMTQNKIWVLVGILIGRQLISHALSKYGLDHPDKFKPINRVDLENKITEQWLRKANEQR